MISDYEHLKNTKPKCYIYKLVVLVLQYIQIKRGRRAINYLYLFGMTDIKDVMLGGGGVGRREARRKGKKGLMLHLHILKNR